MFTSELHRNQYSFSDPVHTEVQALHPILTQAYTYTTATIMSVHKARPQQQQHQQHNFSPASESGVVLKALYKMNWMLIYYVAILLELIALSLKVVKSRLHTLLSGQRGSTKSPLELLQSHRAELKKHPNHLAVILSKDTVQYEDLSKLIHWAMGLGVQYFSLYDPKGKKRCGLL